MRNVTFSTSDEGLKRLERMRQMCEAKDGAQVIRQALANYELILKSAVDGAKIIIRYEDGTEKELRFLP
jgi:hypothetical protein